MSKMEIRGMGINFLLGVQGKGRVHEREDVGVAIWNKGGFEVCILQVKHPLNP
jgi:hypothetical protein